MTEPVAAEPRMFSLFVTVEYAPAAPGTPATAVPTPDAPTCTALIERLQRFDGRPRGI